MTRYLTVTCSATRCTAEGRVQMHGLEANKLPPGWLAVSSSYDGQHLELCSLICLADWAASMLKVRQSQREWQSKPLPVKPIDQHVPEGALL